MLESTRGFVRVVGRRSGCGLEAAVCGVALLGGPACADWVHDEATQGDLSDLPHAPTPLALSPGANIVAGTNGPSGVPDVPDLDYFTVVVPSGYTLSSVMLENASVGGAFSFVAIQAGASVTVSWDRPTAEPLLGWAHYGSSDVGSDLLPLIGEGAGAVGFTGPLGPGQYTLWLMELDGAEPHAYRFSLGLTAVPGPGGAFVIAAACLARRARRSGERRAR